MAGHNHYSNCSCGWCVGGGCRQFSRPVRSPAFGSLFDSFINPNATCPVCGQPVFFYASPYGGRVYFDELGPPWPKHPCTDNPILSSSSRAPTRRNVFNSGVNAEWRIHGWSPIEILASRQVGDWLLVRGKRLASKSKFTRIVSSRHSILPGVAAHTKDGAGHTKDGAYSIFQTLSFLDGSSGHEKISQDYIFHRCFQNCKEKELRDALQGNCDSLIAIVRFIIEENNIYGKIMESPSDQKNNIVSILRALIHLSPLVCRKEASRVFGKFI